MWDDLKADLEKKLNFRLNCNQWREIKRLIHEITVRENITGLQVFDKIKKIPSLDTAKGRDIFFALKKGLLALRFPLTAKQMPIDARKVFLPEIKEPLPQSSGLSIPFQPQKIYIEKEVRNSCLAERFKELFPEAEYEELDAYYDYLKQHPFQLTQLKRPLVFIVKEKWDFVKPCPCTSGVMGCRYWIFNLGFGCPFDCSYCFLQQYSNIPGLILPANLDDFFERFDAIYKKLTRPIRIGTGEFCDSLALDHVTGYSSKLIEYFRGKDLYFELKTKSDCIGNVIDTAAGENIVLSWSLNPRPIASSEEKSAASPEKRLQAARAVQDKGYSLGFHFDPVIYSNRWEEEYAGLIEKLYAALKPPFKWISLGTLRSQRELKNICEQRFPESKIFYGELFLGQDKKLRYPPFLRVAIYKKMLSLIRRHDSQTPVYLCMEPSEIWQACGYGFTTPQEVEKYLIAEK